jgi:hypothetical protein
MNTKDKQKEFYANSPEHRHILAHEPEKGEIKRVFRDLPSVKVIIFPSGNVFREELGE